MKAKKKQTIRILLTVFILSCLSVNLQARDIGDTIDVVKYEIHLQNTDIQQKTIQAYTNVHLTTKVDSLDIVLLELMQLTIDSVFIDNEKISDFTHEDPILEIPLSNAINTGDTIIVKVYYHGEPFHESWGGFHFTSSYAFNLGVGISHIPHNLGKAWFPCVDNFTDRASYSCYVTVDDDLKAICGGMLVETIDNGDSTLTFHWDLPQEIPTYLASVAIGDYVLWEKTYEGIERDIPVSIYVRPIDTAKVAGSFEHLDQITRNFENHFGPYGWGRIGYVGTSQGAMEHATNIAYPNGSINGGLGNEWLYAHELFHMWFGDLVTCCSAEEMWINEGWATYCQIFYLDDLYGNNEFKTTLREKHGEVLQYCHTSTGDGSYFPLNDIPQTHTYGMTAYDKGATVVQSLRAYLGDSLFFESITAFLEANAYTSVCSEDLRDFLTTYTGIDMTDFFDNWIFTPGTPGYSIDSFYVNESGKNYEVHVYPRQKRKGYNYTGNANIIEVTFMNQDWNSFTDTIHFSGKTGHTVKTLPFAPSNVFIDLEERTCDATTDSYKTISGTGEFAYPETFFTAIVNVVTDSALLRVTHHWTPPDSIKNPVEGITLSDYRYWTVEGINLGNLNVTGKFHYNKYGFLDNNLIVNETDSLVILYRENAGEEWQFIDFTQQGVWLVGYLFVDNLRAGQYTLAVLAENFGVNDPVKSESKKMKIFPNPSKTDCTIEYKSGKNLVLEIYSSKGDLVKEIQLPANRNQIRLNTDQLGKGTYHVILIENGQYLAQDSIILID